MTFEAHVINGQIVPDRPIVLPEGAAVQIEVLAIDSQKAPAATEQIPTIYERLKTVVGAAKGLPADASTNVDHYLYGRPKK